MNNHSMSLGDKLKQTRLDKELTINDVAKYLHLKKEVIEKLETEPVEDLCNNVFFRGYLRSYAKFLHFPEAELQSYLSQYTLKSPEEKYREEIHSSIEQQNEVKSKKMEVWVILTTFLVFLFVAGFAMKFWWEEHQVNEEIIEELVNQSGVSESESNNELYDNQTSENLNNSSNSASELVSDTINERTQILDDTITAIVANSDSTQPNITETAEVANNEKVIDLTQNILTMEFTDECWVKVADAKTKQTIYQGLQKAGNSLSFNENINYAINLGNVFSVNMKYKGENVDLKKISKNRATLKFELDPEKNL